MKTIFKWCKYYIRSKVKKLIKKVKETLYLYDHFDLDRWDW